MRPPICPVCGEVFVKQKMGQKTCFKFECAVTFGRNDAEKKKKAQERIVEKSKRQELRERKEKQKSRPALLKEAQKAFNAFIRERDKQAGHTCISSGRPLDWSGNATDAGHYRSVGAAYHLRFDERNCHAQSKHDNKYLAGNVVEYRINLIQRIGFDAVEALENDNTPRHWTAEDIRNIRDEYLEKLRELKKNS